MPFAIQPGQTVLFTGDSITDCGRRDAHRPLGAGYVRACHDLILAKYPDHGNTFINTGIGGNNVRNLDDRWTDDVVRHQPDWLSIMIGINDCNQTLSGREGHVTPEQYHDHYGRILERTRAETDARLVLMTPFYLSVSQPGEAHGYRGRVMEALPKYIATVEEMAKRYDARLVRTHEMFQRHLKHISSDAFSNDAVHLNETGALLLAHAWLDTMDW